MRYHPFRQLGLKMLAIGAGDFERRTSQLRLQQLKRVVKYSIDIDLTELSIASAGEVQKVINDP